MNGFLRTFSLRVATRIGHRSTLELAQVHGRFVARQRLTDPLSVMPPIGSPLGASA